MDLETIKKMKTLLADECNYRLSDDVMTDFLMRMDIVKVKNRRALIEGGSINRDIYIVKDGIIAEIYFDGTNERCWAFGLPGTMFFSSPGYYLRRPAFFRVVACCDSEFLHISKQDFDNMLASSHEFARWALSMAQSQIYFFEYKTTLISGNASSKFRTLVKNRPEIIKYVPNKLIASYLGITQQYLSNLKRRMLKDD